MMIFYVYRNGVYEDGPIKKLGYAFRIAYLAYGESGGKTPSSVCVMGLNTDGGKANMYWFNGLSQNPPFRPHWLQEYTNKMKSIKDPRIDAFRSTELWNYKNKHK